MVWWPSKQCSTQESPLWRPDFPGSFGQVDLWYGWNMWTILWIICTLWFLPFCKWYLLFEAGPPCFNLAPDQQTAARTDSILFCFGSQLSTQGYNNLAVVSWVGIKLCSWASPRESLHSKSVWFVLHKINQDKQECKSLVGRRCWGSHGEVTVPSLNGGHCPRPHSQSNPPSTLC